MRKLREATMIPIVARVLATRKKLTSLSRFNARLMPQENGGPEREGATPFSYYGICYCLLQLSYQYKKNYSYIETPFRDRVYNIGRVKKMVELGDIVDAGFGADYGACTVCRVHEDGTVDLFRPYVQTSDFSTHSQNSEHLICYLGFEEVKKVNPKRLKVLRRSKRN